MRVCGRLGVVGLARRMCQTEESDATGLGGDLDLVVLLCYPMLESQSKPCGMLVLWYRGIRDIMVGEILNQGLNINRIPLNAAEV